MPRLQTRLTELIGCRVPVVGAAMTGVSTAALAVGVHNGGGLGSASSKTHVPSRDSISRELDEARKLLGGPSGRLPIAFGIFGWRLENMPEAESRELIELITRSVRVIWLSFGTEITRWARLARESDPDVLIFVLVSNEAEASAAAALKVDALIVQGIEAGGHGSANGAPIVSLLPAVIRDLGDARPILLAAGGIVNGAQMAAMLALGADGVVLGTRLLATPEADYAESCKQAVVAASSAAATVRTTVFDTVRGTTGWPDAIDGRALRNKTTEELAAGRSEAELKTDYEAAVKTSDTSRIVVWSGTSVGLVPAVMPAADVVAELERDAIAALQRCQVVA